MYYSEKYGVSRRDIYQEITQGKIKCLIKNNTYYISEEDEGLKKVIALYKNYEKLMAYAQKNNVSIIDILNCYKQVN